MLKLDFYKPEGLEWEFEYSFDSINSSNGVDTFEMMDFNFDGVLDARLYLGTGARGANEYHAVFLREPTSSKFSMLKSKGSIPNLIVNLKTQKIEATRYYGKTSFEEYEIIGDSLKIVNGVEVWSENDWTYRSYKFYDEKGAVYETTLDSILDQGESAFSAKPLE